jgi:hypothetical protein
MIDRRNETAAVAAGLGTGRIHLTDGVRTITFTATREFLVQFTLDLEVIRRHLLSNRRIVTFEIPRPHTI